MSTIQKIFVVIVFCCGMYGCSTIKTTITSEPPDAQIYSGAAASSLQDEGWRTPFTITHTDVGPYWKPWFYQVKKQGFYNSEIAFKDEGHGDRQIHFVLKPLPVGSLSSAQSASAQSTQQYNCSELSDADIDYLYKSGHSYLDRDNDGVPCEEERNSKTSIPSSTSMPSFYPDAPTSDKGPVQVKGYYRKDGTYVRPHTRSR